MRLIVWGAGYSGRSVADAARSEGWEVTLVSRTPGPDEVAFDRATPALLAATHLLATAPPGEAGDPVLAAYGQSLGHLHWAGYLSSTGVYGNRDGAWVDEDTPPNPGSERAGRRLAAESAWRDACRGGPALDILRLAGIYGPGRSVLDDLRAGTARRVDAPDHAFGRIHRDDIARLVLAATGHPGGPVRLLHGNDDLPAPGADVVAEGARLLGLSPPPLTGLADALAGMSTMARSFWADNRKVACVKTKAALNLSWRYPTFREGLRAVHDAEQRLDRRDEQSEVLRA